MSMLACLWAPPLLTWYVQRRRVLVGCEGGAMLPCQHSTRGGTVDVGSGNPDTYLGHTGLVRTLEPHPLHAK